MLASYAGELFPALEDLLQEQAAGKPNILHIADGESVAGTLRGLWDPWKCLHLW
jgi:hypothetical protein